MADDRRQPQREPLDHVEAAIAFAIREALRKREGRTMPDVKRRPGRVA